MHILIDYSANQVKLLQEFHPINETGCLDEPRGFFQKQKGEFKAN